jgi:hypothetical protein
MSPEIRAELIQALLSEEDLRHAQQVISKFGKNKDSGRTLFSKATAILTWAWGTDDESLRKEMKKRASSISDSNFLLELASIEDEVLKTAALGAVTLAHTQLSSSIDSTVKKLTDDVLRMQQEEGNRYLQYELEAAQRKELGIVIVKFIRSINNASAGRKTSCVKLSPSGLPINFA